MLTLTHTAKLSRSCHRSLEAFLYQQRALWSAGLEERIRAYRKTGKSITMYEQYKGLTEIRYLDSEFSRYRLLHNAPC